MDPGRAAKRRKLDAEDDTPTSRKAATPVTTSKRRTPQSRVKAATADTPLLITGLTSKPSAQDVWQEAKAKRQVVPKGVQRKGVEMYDNIDGAHGGQDARPGKQQFSVKKKAFLDPLRNQKSDTTQERVPASSPKFGGALGFFKQFHKLKDEESTPDTEQICPSTSHSDPRNTGGDAIRDVHETSEDESPTRSPSNGKAVLAKAKRDSETEGITSRHGTWQYGTKKTLEDEIRELAEAACKDADEGNGEATAVRVSQRQRRPAQALSVEHHFIRSGVTDVVNRTTEVSNVKVAKRSRADRTEHDENAKNQHQKSSFDAEVTATEDVAHKSSVETVPLLTPAKQPLAASPPKLRRSDPTDSTMPEYVFEQGQFSFLRKFLLERLTGKRANSLVGLNDEYSKVLNLVTQTVTAGESNSMLVIGARGSGKTSLVEQILRKQRQDHADDFLVVKLNGFIHTDDKIALREIWRQLGRDMKLEEDEATARSYADTLTTLLALLSHPSEQGLQQSENVTKSVIFVLEEFDLFAGHPRQTLLYNLFDIAQSRKAPIAVLGLTTRIDVAESLEKRVKSRFSHRYVYLGPAKSFTAYQDMCRAACCIRSDQLSLDERMQLEYSHSGSSQAPNTQIAVDTISAWNSTVNTLLDMDVCRIHLRRLYHSTKSIAEFKASMLVGLAAMPVNFAISSTTLIEHFTSSLSSSSLTAPDSKLGLLASLSTLQLALLTCAARQNAIHGTETMSFALVYEEYKVLASKARLQASASGSLAQGAGARISAKGVAKDAWEELLESGLIMDDGRGGGRVDVGLEEIGMSGVDLGQWGRWCREI